MSDFLPIRGFPGYKINNMGELYSTRRRKHPERIQGSVWDGILRVTLTNGKTKRTVPVHTLVAETFLDKPCGLNKAVHIDGNTRNNAASNLQWVKGRRQPSTKANSVTQQTTTISSAGLFDFEAEVKPTTSGPASASDLDRKLKMVAFAHELFKDDPDSFRKIVAATFDLA